MLETEAISEEHLKYEIHEKVDTRRSLRLLIVKSNIRGSLVAHISIIRPSIGRSSIMDPRSVLSHCSNRKNGTGCALLIPYFRASRPSDFFASRARNRFHHDCAREASSPFPVRSFTRFPRTFAFTWLVVPTFGLIRTDSSSIAGNPTLHSRVSSSSR